MEVVNGGDVVNFKDAREKRSPRVHAESANDAGNSADDKRAAGVHHQVATRTDAHTTRQRRVLRGGVHCNNLTGHKT